MCGQRASPQRDPKRNCCASEKLRKAAILPKNATDLWWPAVFFSITKIKKILSVVEHCGNRPKWTFANVLKCKQKDIICKQNTKTGIKDAPHRTQIMCSIIESGQTSHCKNKTFFFNFYFANEMNRYSSAFSRWSSQEVNLDLYIISCVESFA